MGKTEAVRIRRGLSLYKQPLAAGRGSPNWYARVYMPIGGRAFHVKSTGTSDRCAAERWAESFWTDCVLLQRSGGQEAGVKIDSWRFDLVAERWLESRRVADIVDSPRTRDT